MPSIEVVIRQPGFPDRVIPLQEGRVRLGRADDNEIVLSDVGVSRRHAQIVVDGGEVRIEDLGSGNGTYYLGQRIKSRTVRDQDEIVIDPFILQFQIEGGPAPSPAAGPAAANLPRIEVVVGNGIVGNQFPIVDGRLTIGRAEDRDVVVPDAASSRHHCEIVKQGDEYVLRDNGSANGVFVNAVRVRECTLSNGDLIRIGNTEMRFVNPAAAAAPTQQFDEAQPATPLASYHDALEEDTPKSSAMMVGAAVASLLVLTGAGLGAVLIIGGVVWYLTAAPVQVATIPPRPPTWQLELPARPAQTDEELIAFAREAAERRDYRGTIEALYRVLLAKPDEPTAKKFSAFAGEMLVVDTLAEELAERLAVEQQRAQRRDALLARLERAPKSRRGAILRQLESDYREDPVVIAHSKANPQLYRQGAWSLTNEQISHRDQLAKMKREVETGQYSKAIRTGRRLLRDTREAEIRDQVQQQLAIAEEALARKIDKVWRAGMMAAALGDDETAIEDFTRLLTIDEYNRSAELHLDALKKRP